MNNLSLIHSIQFSRYWGFRLLLLLIVLSALGCVNWSKDVSRYREVLDGPDASILRIEPAHTADLSLLDALAITNADNESIASSGEDYIQALAEKMRQAGTFLPTLSLGPSYSFTSDKNNSYSMSADASANGSLSDLSDIESAKRNVEQREQLLLDVRETVLLSVVETYYDVLRYEEQTDVYQQSVTFQEERVRDQEARQELGNGRPLDVAQSRADLAGTRADLTRARTFARNARSALARLMGVARVDGKLVDGFDSPTDERDDDAWISRALESRQDLLAAHWRVEGAKQDLNSAIRQYFPSVSINFAYYLQNDLSPSRDWTGGININIPIFSALSIEAQIRAAWSSYRQSGLEESQTRRVVVDDVQQSLNSLASSEKRLIDLQTQVDAAQAAFTLAQRAYELGSGTNLERLAQQDTLLTAQLELVDERFNQKIAYLRLLRYVGQLALVLPHRDPVIGRVSIADNQLGMSLKVKP